MKYEYQIENVGYTRNKKLAVATLGGKALTAFNERSEKEGTFPAGVIGLKSAHFSPDEKAAGEWKYFASITLLVEAASIYDAEELELPDKFLNGIAGLVADTVPSIPFSLDGSWEILSVDPD